ncbi:TOPRS ligase, partial [Herpetotheres cachinnans]|nr:TOPRS ligase [Herpetotheres cachinnans]
MATGTEWSCSICQDAHEDVAYAMPCQHQFCMGCILRYIKRKPSCPLCRRLMETVSFSVRAEDDYLQCAILPRNESPAASSQAGGAPGPVAENSPHRPVASPPSSPQGMLSPAEQGAAGTEAVGGLLPEVWAALFKRREHLLDPVLPWLRQQLAEIYGDQWWMTKNVESFILHGLCACGPDREVMVQTLQEHLEDYTPLQIQLLQLQPLGFSASRSSSSSSRLPRSSPSRSSASSSRCTTSREATSNSSLASSSSPAGAHREEKVVMLEATLHGGPGRPPSAPVPAEQEQTQEEPRQVVVVAGPSAQGSRCSPSAPGRDRDCSPGGPRRPLKRRATDPQDSPQHC